MDDVFNLGYKVCVPEFMFDELVSTYPKNNFIMISSKLSKFESF